MSTSVTATVRLLSFQAIRCLTAEAHARLETRVRGLAEAGGATVVEPFENGRRGFSRLTDIQGAGRFELALEDGNRATGMCSLSLPADVLVTWTPDHIATPPSLRSLCRRLYAALEELELVEFYDLLVISAVAEDITGLLQTEDGATQETWMQPAPGIAFTRLSLPVGDLVVILADTEERAFELQARAIDIARVHGGCRDLIVRLTAHRHDGIAPLTDALVNAPLAEGVPAAESLRELVAQRQGLLALERDLAVLERDGDCLHEYAADLESRLTATVEQRLVLGSLHQELALDELAPLEMLLAQTRHQHGATASYLRDQIDLAYAETNLRISETNLEISHNVRRLQVWQILLAVAVLALTVVQVIDAVRRHTGGSTGGQTTTVQTPTTRNGGTPEDKPAPQTHSLNADGSGTKWAPLRSLRLPKSSTSRDSAAFSSRLSAARSPTCQSTSSAFLSRATPKGR
jgi:hypothetical protein